MVEQNEYETGNASDSDPSIRKQVFSSSIWSLGLRAGEKILGLVRLTILARLLTPYDFGVFGIALLAIALIEALSNTGFEDALIQKDRDIMPYLDTAWTAQAIRGLILAVLLFLLAPSAASFFKNPDAALVLCVLSINMILLGLTNISMVFFLKEFKFHKQFIFVLSGLVVDVGVSIYLAVIWRNVWALVYGILAGNIVRLVISHVIAHPVRFRIQKEKIKELFSYGRWVWGSWILHFLLNEGDDIIVGKILGTRSLGIYRMSFLYGNVPATEVSHVISKVTFPAFSKLQGDTGRLREAFIRTLRVTNFLSAPLAAGIIVMTPSFVRIFLSDNWSVMIAPMQILTFFGFLRSVGATTGTIFLAAGRPDIITKINLLRLVILAAIIYPFTIKLGLIGASLAVTTVGLIANPLMAYYALRITVCRWRLFAVAVAFPFCAATVMIFCIMGLHAVTDPGFGLGVFIMSILFGALVYGGLVWLLGPRFHFDIIQTFRGWRS